MELSVLSYVTWARYLFLFIEVTVHFTKFCSIVWILTFLYVLRCIGCKLKSLAGNRIQRNSPISYDPCVTFLFLKQYFLAR